MPRWSARPPRRSRRGSVARLDVRPLPILSARQREPLSPGALHRVSTRRRVRRATPSPTPASSFRFRGPHATSRSHRSCARASSATGRCALPAMPSASASTGSAAAAHLVAQVARHEGRRVFAFTRPGDAAAQAFARSLGAAWAGDSTTAPPEPLDAALIFAPARRSGARGAARRRAGRCRRVRRHSHEPDPGAFL